MVAQKSTRQIALNVFRHLHSLSLRFHLGKKTGSLSSIIDRGRRGVVFLLSSLVYNVIPTLFELSVVCAVLQFKFGTPFSMTALASVIAYSIFTIAVTQWRTKFRKRMNLMENESSSRVIDSLINYETVKYFCNEQHEAERVNKYLVEYEKAALKTITSLSILNFGQTAIFSVALTVLMISTARGVLNGTMTVGDLVMVGI